MATLLAEALEASPAMKRTCVLDGKAAAELLRDAIGVLSSGDDAQPIMVRIMEALPKVAISRRDKVGGQSVYSLIDGSTVIRRTHLISGGYNRIVRADFVVGDTTTPALLRIIKHDLEGLSKADKVTLSFVENVMHVVLQHIAPEAIVPIICPIVLPRKSPPRYDFGSLLERARKANDLYTVMSNQIDDKDELDSEVLFDVTRKLFHLLASLQKSCKFVHRDLKEDNVMVYQNGDVKLIDFGCAEYEYGGERIACDCEPYLRGHSFNDSVDVVYYCLSLYDSTWSFKQDTPEFYKFIRSVAGSTYKAVCEKFPGHAKQSGESRVQNTMHVLYDHVKHGSCSPEMALAKLDKYDPSVRAPKKAKHE